MTSETIIAQLRPLRRELVLAAEEVIKYQGKMPERTQFSRLLNLCAEASCSEELENYLRYQAGRKGSNWKPEFVRKVIDGVSSVLNRLPQATDGTERDRLRVEAWRLYATYLRRSHIWHEETTKRAKQGKPR